MRALIVPSWYPAGPGDLRGSFFREQIGILREAGHDLTVLGPRLVMPGGRTDSDPRDGVLRPAFPAIPLLRGLSMRGLIIRSNQVARTQGLLGQPVDVVHAHTVWPAGPVAASLAAKLGAPLVLTEHRPSSLTRFSGRHRRLIHPVLERAQVVSTVSAPFSRELERRWRLESRSVEVLHNPVDPMFMEDLEGIRPPQGGHRFLHVSHPSAVKRVDDIVGAFRRLPEDVPAQLVIVGGDESTARARAELLGGNIATVAQIVDRSTSDPGTTAAPRVLITPGTSREGVRELMDASDTFVLASRVESFGVVLAEAMSRGLSLITTDTWGGSTVAPVADGKVVPIGDIKALASAMTHSTDDSPADRCHRQLVARENFGPESYTRRVRDLWQSAIDRDQSK